MKLLTKSEANKIYKKQESERIVKGARIAQLIDDEVKKINGLKDKFEKQSQLINESYQKLFDEKLKEIAELQKKKLKLLEEIKQLEDKKYG